MFKKSQRLVDCKIECKKNMEEKEEANVSQSKNGVNGMNAFFVRRNQDMVTKPLII